MIPIVAPLRDAWRHHWRSALVVALAAAAGLGAALPALLLAPGLRPAVVPPDDWGVAWRAFAWGPTVTEAHGLRVLAGVAVAGAVALLVITGLTVLATSVARAYARRGEIVVRRAVGASRRMLGGAALMEGVLMAVIAAGGAAVLTVLATDRLAAAWPGAWTPGDLTAAIAAAVGVAILIVSCALLPLGYARPRLPGADAAELGVPLLVPVAQFGFALIALTVGAQITARADVPDGRTVPAGGVVARVYASNYSALLARARAESTVTLASLTSPGALTGLGIVDVSLTDCGRCVVGMVAAPLRPARAVHYLVTADSFDAMGLAVLEGRALRDDDDAGAPRVAVVSRGLAQAYFEDGRAVGRVLLAGSEVWYKVVGVVEEWQGAALGAGDQTRHAIYLSVLQHAAGPLDLLIRTSGGDAAQVLEALASVTAPPVSEAAYLAEAAAPGRWFARVLRLEAWAALAVAALGMLAVMRRWIAGLLPEIALRRAVGARRVHILGRIGLRAVAVALGGGVVAAWLGPVAAEQVSRAVAHLPPWSVELLRGPALVLTVATLGGALVPAWRAVRATPAESGGRALA